MPANDFEERFRIAKSKHIQTQLMSWQLHCTFLDSLQRIHLVDADWSDDRELAEIHTEIANLTKQTRDQYQRLIDKFDGHELP